MTARAGRRRSRAWAGVALAGALWGGCVPSLQGHRPRDPALPLPATFGEPQAAQGGQVLPTTAIAGQAWREFFSSRQLVELIETALADNRDLNLQMQDIIIAHNEVAARRGEYLPKLGARVGAGIEKVGEDTSQGASDRALGLAQNLGDFTFGLVGSWEADVFGRLRGARAAADLRYLASIEAKNFLVTQLVAEIARAYYELVAIDSQLHIIATNIEVQANALAVVRLQKEAARVTELAVQRFEAEWLKYRSRYFHLEQQRIRAQNRLNFLAGRYPQQVERQEGALDVVLPRMVASGLPAELLANRPDVRGAELELAASKIDVKVARAAFYPAVSLEAGVGYRAFNPRHLVTTPASLVYNLAGNLVAPLLNRQGIAAHYRSANAAQLKSVLAYERTLLGAYTEVVNQLARAQNLGQGAQLQTEQVAILVRAVDVSTMLFQSAEADYMEVLLTRRDSLEAQLELVETKRRQFQAMVDLYQALGGGWRSEEGRGAVKPS